MSMRPLTPTIQSRQCPCMYLYVDKEPLVLFSGVLLGLLSAYISGSDSEESEGLVGTTSSKLRLLKRMR